MSKLSIVLVDTDERYLIPLELKFIEELGNQADIMVITELKYLEEYFSSPRHIDVLLINEKLYSKDIEKHNIANTFLLLEQCSDENSDYLLQNCIYI